MTDTGASAREEGPAPEQTGRGTRRWRGAIIGAALFAVGTASGFAVATAHGMPWWMLGAGAHHRMDPERIAARVDRRVERVLSRVDATAEQRGKVSGITKAAISDLTAQGIMPWEARRQIRRAAARRYDRSGRLRNPPRGTDQQGRCRIEAHRAGGHRGRVRADGRAAPRIDRALAKADVARPERPGMIRVAEGADRHGNCPAREGRTGLR